MQKKEKKVINHAESTSRRIIAYSNNEADNYHLVAENKTGRIKIFLEKENARYNQSITEDSFKGNVKEVLKTTLYFLVCNYIYILWLSTNSIILKYLMMEDILIIILLNTYWSLLFSLIMINNKYRIQFISLLILTMIIENVFEENVYNFIYNMVGKIEICLVIIFIAILFMLFFEYIKAFRYEKNRKAEKSKHSAEHMMCNYIEKYQTYPKSIKELRKVSRFTLGCGGLYGDFILEENMTLLISNILIMIISVDIINRTQFIDKFMIYTIRGLLFSIIFLTLIFLAMCLGREVLKYLIYSILITFSQVINTLPKRKIKYKDLKMAQMLSKKFFEWQYPDDIEPKQKTN